MMDSFVVFAEALLKPRNGEVPEPINECGPDTRRLFAVNDIVVTLDGVGLVHALTAAGADPPTYLLDAAVETRALYNGYQPRFRGDIGPLLVHLGVPGAERILASPAELCDRTPADLYQDKINVAQTLWSRIQEDVDLAQALHRGRYLKAVAKIEATGIPIDVEVLRKLEENRERILLGLIAELAPLQQKLFDGLAFKETEFDRWARRYRDWPTRNGRLRLDDNTFESMVDAHPELYGLWTVRRTMNRFRKGGLLVGEDGRNRAPLRPFMSTTSRNQPSPSRFIFGMPAWMRGLIKPGPGRALAYIDYSSQEFGIAAALSKDQEMQAAYDSGDPYLYLAKVAKRVPATATKTTHPNERKTFKVVGLGLQYGMGEGTLALRLGTDRKTAKLLMQSYEDAFPTYTAWREAAVSYGQLMGELSTVYGWKVNVTETSNPRSLKNFPLQANGAEMLRTACIGMVEAGLTVCAPIHDAVLIEADLADIDGATQLAQQVMQEASQEILGGFALRTDAKITKFPDRYVDGRDTKTWEWAMASIRPQTPG